MRGAEFTASSNVFLIPKAGHSLIIATDALRDVGEYVGIKDLAVYVDTLVLEKHKFLERFLSKENV